MIREERTWVPEGSSSPPRPRHDRLEGHVHVCQGKQNEQRVEEGLGDRYLWTFFKSVPQKISDWDSPAEDLLNGAIIRILQDGRLSA